MLIVNENNIVQATWILFFLRMLIKILNSCLSFGKKDPVGVWFKINFWRSFETYRILRSKSKKMQKKKQYKCLWPGIPPPLIPSFSFPDVPCDPTDLIWRKGTPFEENYERIWFPGRTRTRRTHQQWLWCPWSLGNSSPGWVGPFPGLTHI